MHGPLNKVLLQHLSEVLTYERNAFNMWLLFTHFVSTRSQSVSFLLNLSGVFMAKQCTNNVLSSNSDIAKT